MKNKIFKFLIIISGIILSVIKYIGFSNWELPFNVMVGSAIAFAIIFIISILYYNKTFSNSLQAKIIKNDIEVISENERSSNKAITVFKGNKKSLIISFFVILVIVVFFKKTYNENKRIDSESLKTRIDKDSIKSQNNTITFNNDFKPKINDFNVGISTDFHPKQYDLDIKLDIKNTNEEVIEVAKIETILKIKYKGNEPKIKVFPSREFTNLVFDKNGFGVGHIVDLSGYIKNDFENEYDFLYSFIEQIDMDEKMKKKYLRTQEISKIIEKEYNNVWYPNKSKKLRLRYTIEKLDLYKYYRAEEVIFYIRLIAENSIGLNYNKIILEKEITEVWNNTFYYKKSSK
ncbi:MAG: hypothetical protein L3J09_05950 [Flavobacteriaceae bacterium]|nr:hypothetical protein [Flavobacteriaceae bacterium]